MKTKPARRKEDLYLSVRDRKKMIRHIDKMMFELDWLHYVLDSTETKWGKDSASPYRLQSTLRR